MDNERTHSLWWCCILIRKMEVRYETSSSMNVPLIHNKNGDITTKEEIVVEVKKQLWLSGPLICVSLLQFCLDLISFMFVGHLGELALSGASVATSFTSIAGFSLLMGMACALDTFCGQSYGAKQYHMFGIHMQRAIIVLTIGSIPLAGIWANTGLILKSLGQDTQISDQAGLYALYMIPSLFAYGLLQCQVRFLQTQNIVFPMMISSGMTTLLHLLVCWFLVFKSGLGIKGAALANSISYWVNVLLLVFYIKFSTSCRKTWTGFSKKSLLDIPSFVRLAIPSAVMICMEVWCFEIVVLLSGLLPEPQLETSVLSICVNTSAALWMISLGLSGSVSTRVSNELGAGHPKTARLALHVVIFMAITVSILVGLFLMLIHNVLGYAFSNEVEVVKYVATMIPLLALSNFLDGLQSVLTGAVTGCGFQKIGAFINLGSYYLVGLPCAALLAFVFHLRGRGLWLGIISALTVQVLLLFFVMMRINWKEEAKKAGDRVHDDTIPVGVVY